MAEPTPTPTTPPCYCFTANNIYEFSINIKFTDCKGSIDQVVTVPQLDTVQICAESIKEDPYGITSLSGLCTDGENCDGVTPTPTPTITETSTPTPTPTLTETSTPTPVSYTHLTLPTKRIV